MGAPLCTLETYPSALAERRSPIASLALMIKRHPLPMSAHFEQVLVLTYALPKQALTPLLPPGLELDCFGS